MSNAAYIFPFFRDGVGSQDVSNESKEFHNQNYSDLTLEVKGGSGAFPIKVKGSLDVESEAQWTDLAIIDLSDFSVLDKIEKDGLYAIGVGGVQRVKVATYVAGSETITGKFA